MRTKHLFVAAPFVLSVCVGLAGCDDDSGSGLGGVSSTTKISDLSTSDQKKVCDALQAKFDRVNAGTTKLTCTVTGYTLANGNANQCNTQRTSCIDSAASTPNADFDLDCDNSMANLQDCGGVTVGDLTSCADALTSTVEAAANKVSCSSSAADLQSAAMLTTPPECSKLDAACPELSGSNGSN